MSKKKIDSSKDMVTLDITLDRVRVTVENGSEKEVLSRVQSAIIEEIAKKMPRFSYLFVNAEALTQETAMPGMLVEEISNSKNKGIVTSVNQKTINVTFTGNRSVQGNACLFKLTNAPFEEVASFYKKFTVNETDSDGVHLNSTKLDFYSEGNAGYLHNKGEITPVVIGKSKGSKYNLYIINGGGRFFTLTEEQMKLFFKGSM